MSFCYIFAQPWVFFWTEFQKEQSTKGDAGANADLFPINTSIFSLLKSASLKGEACLP